MSTTYFSKLLWILSSSCGYQALSLPNTNPSGSLPDSYPSLTLALIISSKGNVPKTVKYPFFYVSISFFVIVFLTFLLIYCFFNIKQSVIYSIRGSYTLAPFYLCHLLCFSYLVTGVCVWMIMLFNYFNAFFNSSFSFVESRLCQMPIS